MSARDELRDCFLSDSRDRFEAAADAYSAEMTRANADWLEGIGQDHAASMLRYSLDLDAEMADATEQGQPATPPATIENYPGELAMLRGVLGVVRSIARHGDLGDTTGGRELRQVIAEHYADERDAYAEQGEKDTPTGATSTHQHTPRERHHLLAKAIRAEGGEWTPHRVHKLYRAHGITGLFRVTVRRDLAELHRDGHLVLHDQDPGRRFYTPTTEGGSR